MIIISCLARSSMQLLACRVISEVVAPASYYAMTHMQLHDILHTQVRNLG